jgi:alkanesulfonate monooxygenase SsuD/methylene tetrahydromethanopterin reductase-like flavin-dependent oxidoreductase (luciferase family)
VPGYQEGDFDVVGVDFADRRRAFWEGLGRVTTALGRGEDPSPIAADPAVAGLQERSIPLLAGAGGPVGVRRAARLGAGLLLTSLRPAEEARDLMRLYRDSGGTGSAVLIRRAHVGDDAGGFGSSMAHWSRGDGGGWLRPDSDALLTGSPAAVADALVEAVRASGCSALNLRLDVSTRAPSQVAGQLDVLGAEVLPRVRATLGWRGD